jgi:Pro-kumamolisin, activation domain
MSQKIVVRIFLSAVIALALSFATQAQSGNTLAIPSRITQAISESSLVTLRGNRHPFAQAAFDQQQDSSSANFHQWLTPQQFGQQFGPSDQDVETISNWLQSHGFSVAGVSKGRTVIEFSGTAGQVRDTFRASIHQYSINGETHWANASDPQIPAALAPVIAGINTLYNFPRKAMHHLGGAVTHSASTGQYQSASPFFTLSGTCGVPGVGCYGVSPYDFATIYNLLPLWQGSPATDGTGQTIAVVGESDISLSDAGLRPRLLLHRLDIGYIKRVMRHIGDRRRHGKTRFIQVRARNFANRLQRKMHARRYPHFHEGGTLDYERVNLQNQTRRAAFPKAHPQHAPAKPSSASFGNPYMVALP